MNFHSRTGRFSAGWLTASLLTLTLLSACATSSPHVAEALAFCDAYTPVYGVDHPAVHMNNAVYLEFCLETTEESP